MMMTSLYLAHGHGILCTRLDRLVLLNNGGHFVLTSIVIHSHFGNEFTIVFCFTPLLVKINST
jgi:hypothetical protein